MNAEYLRSLCYVDTNVFIYLFDRLAGEKQSVAKAEELVRQYCLSPFDSLHVQSALDQQCKFFLSEDMQDGLCVHDQLEIINPFRVNQ